MPPLSSSLRSLPTSIGSLIQASLNPTDLVSNPSSSSASEPASPETPSPSHILGHTSNTKERIPAKIRDSGITLPSLPYRDSTGSDSDSSTSTKYHEKYSSANNSPSSKRPANKKRVSFNKMVNINTTNLNANGLEPLLEQKEPYTQHVELLQSEDLGRPKPRSRQNSTTFSVSSKDSDEDDEPTLETLREAAKDRRRLKLAIALCSTFFFVELIGGLLADSLALLSDSFHLLTDITSFAISLAAIYLSQKKPTSSHTFGYHRAEVLGALFSIFLIWGLTIGLVYEAFERIRNPIEVDGKTMSFIAGIGVCVNISLMFVLGHGHDHHHDDDHRPKQASHQAVPLNDHDDDIESSTMKYQAADLSDLAHEEEAIGGSGNTTQVETQQHHHTNLNISAATLHVLGDLLSSIGVLTSSLLITFFPSMTFLDPVCTFVFSVMVIFTTVGVFRRSCGILMETVPPGMTTEALREAIRTIPGVLDVKRIHVWSLTLSQPAMTARVYINPSSVDDLDQIATIIDETRKLMRTQFGIRQSTIQVELLKETSFGGVVRRDSMASIGSTSSSSLPLDRNGSTSGSGSMATLASTTFENTKAYVESLELQHGGRRAKNDMVIFEVGNDEDDEDEGGYDDEMGGLVQRARS